MKKDSRKLIRMALATSPLLAVYNVAPISLMLNSDIIKPNLPLLPENHSTSLLLFPILFITFNALIIWLVNIWLVKYARARNMSVAFRYCISFLFTFFLVITLTSIGSHLRPFPEGANNFRFYPFIGMAANNTFILIIIDLILNREKKAALEIEKATLEAVNLKSRHEQLKQQIQPHFLFNALNTLKLLVDKSSGSAESYILRLSQFLRATISDEYKEKITIEKDLEIFTDFIELQRVRFPGAIQLENSLSEEFCRSFLLPSFTMQTLAENAIKHNRFSIHAPLKITIAENEGVVSFYNNYNPKKLRLDSVGIGLKNLSERFKILSGEEIDVMQDALRFEVRFKVINR